MTRENSSFIFREKNLFHKSKSMWPSYNLTEVINETAHPRTLSAVLSSGCGEALMGFSPDMHFLLYWFPLTAVNQVPKFSCTSLSKQIPSKISSEKKKERKENSSGQNKELETWEEKRKSYMSKSETWSETKPSRNCRYEKYFLYILKLLFAYLFRSYLLPTDKLKSHTHTYLLHERIMR